MRDLQKYGSQCIDEMKAMGVDINDLPNIIWIVNNRAKSRYGHCSYKLNENKCIIDISEFLLDESITPDEDSLKTTIIHELLHALYPYDGHKGKWKNMANYITRVSHGKYKIKRCTSYHEKGIDMEKLEGYGLKRSEPKYIIKCEKCGHEYVRVRRTSVVKRPDTYRCGVCKGSLKLINVS